MQTSNFCLQMSQPSCHLLVHQTGAASLHLIHLRTLCYVLHVAWVPLALTVRKDSIVEAGGKSSLGGETSMGGGP